jgi:hypothetical protein
MRIYNSCANIIIDGDVYTKGFLGLDWLPSEKSKANAQRYEEWVVFQLNLILKRWSGWSVMSEIFSKHKEQKKIYIRPYAPTLQDPLNAFARPLDPQAATLKGAPQKFAGGPDAGKDIPGKPPGTGKGSDVEILYTPWIFKPGIGGPGTSDPDEILLHELLHGLRQMYGVSLPGTATQRFDTQEEFPAILVTNIYRSETGRVGLRADHSLTSTLSAALSNPSTFANEYHTYLSLMKGENENLFFKLKGLTTIPFNPIAHF